MSKKRRRFLIGIDLGGTKLLVSLFDRRFHMISEEKHKTDLAGGRKSFLKLLIESVKDLVKEADLTLNEVAGLGIGVPGLIDSDGKKVVACPNIAFLKQYSLAGVLKKSLGIPVSLDNDVNLGLYGEQQFGAAKGYKHVIGVFPGTGVGGALILDGKLYRGATGAAGEIGHMLVDPLGPLCGCGKRGCLEALVGRIAIASEASVLAGRQKAKRIYEIAGTDFVKIKSRALKKAISDGDRVIEELICFKANLLGVAIANVCNFLNPEAVVLGGGLVEAMPDLFIREVKRAMRDHAMTSIAKETKIIPAKLKDYAIVFGAAKMAGNSLKKHERN